MMTRNEREYWSERSDDGERRVSLPQHGAVSCCSPITINTARGKVSFEQRVQAHPAQFDIDSDDAIALWYSVSPDEVNDENCMYYQTVSLTVHLAYRIDSH
jgi:hypothetical protein